MGGSFQMEIRLVTPADAPAYRELRLFGLQEASSAFGSTYAESAGRPLSETEERLAASEHAFHFGAFDKGGRLLGMVSLVREQMTKFKHRANIYAMYVHPDGRRHGTGRQLMEAALEQARNMEGLEQVHLTVNATNDPARRLYQAIGFEVCGYDKQGLKEGNEYHDEERMVIFL